MSWRRRGQVREILLQTTEHETPRVNSIHTDAVSARNWARPKAKKVKSFPAERLEGGLVRQSMRSKNRVAVGQRIQVKNIFLYR